jgi:hypothetical protein
MWNNSNENQRLGREVVGRVRARHRHLDSHSYEESQRKQEENCQSPVRQLQVHFARDGLDSVREPSAGVNSKSWKIARKFSFQRSQFMNRQSPKRPLSSKFTVINSEVHPADHALSQKNLALHISHQYLQTQSVEQDFFNKNSFSIKRGVKNIDFIRPIVAEISRILNAKWKFSCKYFQISFLESWKMMIYLLYSSWLIHPYHASRRLLENWSRG